MRHYFKVLAGTLAGAALGVLLGMAALDAGATRNSSGTYSLPAGNPAIPNTLITSSQWNSNFSDLANETTDSLSRSGKGGMTAPLRGLDGAVGAPAFSYTSETNTGDYRKAASSTCRAVAGADVQCWSATGSTITGTLVVSSTITATNGVAATGAASGFNATSGSNTFTGNATHAPLALTPQATPASPGNGEVWVDSGDNTLKAQINGSTATFLTAASSPQAGSLWRDSSAVALTTSADTKYNSLTTGATTAGSVTTDGSGRITAGLTGKYWVTGQLSVSDQASAGGTTFTLKLRKNGAALVTLGVCDTAVSKSCTVSGGMMVSLNSTDYVELWYFTTASVAPNANGASGQLNVLKVN